MNSRRHTLQSIIWLGLKRERGKNSYRFHSYQPTDESQKESTSQTIPFLSGTVSLTARTSGKVIYLSSQKERRLTPRAYLCISVSSLARRRELRDLYNDDDDDDTDDDYFLILRGLFSPEKRLQHL